MLGSEKDSVRYTHYSRVAYGMRNILNQVSVRFSEQGHARMSSGRMQSRGVETSKEVSETECRRSFYCELHVQSSDEH